MYFIFIILNNDLANLTPEVFEGTLAAGDTSITFTSSTYDFSSDGNIDVYSSVYGVNPSAVSVGSSLSGYYITLTFEAQSSDLNVKVVLRKGE